MSLSSDGRQLAPEDQAPGRLVSAPEPHGNQQTSRPTVGPAMPKQPLQQRLSSSPSVDTRPGDSPSEVAPAPTIPSEEGATETLPSNTHPQMPPPELVQEFPQMPPLPGSTVSPSMPGVQPPHGPIPAPNNQRKKEPQMGDQPSKSER